MIKPPTAEPSRPLCFYQSKFVYCLGLLKEAADKIQQLLLVAVVGSGTTARSSRSVYSSQVTETKRILLLMI